MVTVITVLHVVNAFMLVVLVLLQSSKSDLSSLFGGGSQSVFGGRGPASFVEKATIIMGILFMSTSLVLAFWGNEGSVSLIEREAGSYEQPAYDDQAPPASPAAAAPMATDAPSAAPAVADTATPAVDSPAEPAPAAPAATEVPAGQ